MQVLGTLIKIDSSTNELPLPWWHRAPLGFLNGTSVFVSLVEGRGRRPLGDLVVSVINPNNLMIHVRCRRADKPGVLAEVFKVANPLEENINIALAEAVTAESGTMHDVTLILEPRGRQRVSEQLEIKLKKSLEEAGFFGVRSEPRIPDPERMPWHNIGLIDHGWVVQSGWKQALTRHYAGKAESQRFDLNRFVVSADLDNRFLRFVIPRIGAISVEIEHADEPGALQTLTAALQACDLNLLSGLLRRGGARHGNAVLIAVCEPESEVKQGRLLKRIDENIARIDRKYRPEHRINYGRAAIGTIYPRHPDEIVARVPEALKHMVLATRNNEVPKGKTPVFLSRRFIPADSDRTGRILRTVYKTLERQECFALEALVEPGSDVPTPSQVSSKLWASKAGIVLVMKMGKQSDAISMNLAHEYGFMQGQGKPALFLVEKGLEGVVKELTNLSGMNFAYFSADETRAFDSQSEESIEYQLTRWIRRWKLVHSDKPFEVENQDDEDGDFIYGNPT